MPDASASNGHDFIGVFALHYEPFHNIQRDTALGADRAARTCAGVGAIGFGLVAQLARAHP